MVNSDLPARERIKCTYFPYLRSDGSERTIPRHIHALIILAMSLEAAK